MSLILFKNIENNKVIKAKVKPNLLIGRSSPSDIILKHKRISSQHAKIIKENSSFYLIDLNSTNGLKVDGIKQDKILLETGIVITVGPYEITYQSPPKKKKGVQKTSNADEVLKQFLESHPFPTSAPLPTKPELHPLVPALKVKILSGLYAGTEYVMGYGPRVLGPESLDLPFLEPESSALAFKVYNKNKKNYLLPLQGCPLTLFGKEITEASLIQDKQIYQVGSTRIEFLHIKDPYDY